MDAQSIIRIVSLITAGTIFVIGILFLLGFFIPQSVPDNYRILLGSVMVFYAGYRMWMLWMRKRDEVSSDD